MPDEATLRRCWTANPDGAGFMFVRDGDVQIRKGHMKLKGLLSALAAADIQTHEPAVLHFRIATHGRTSAGQTHPFPVCGSYAKMQKVYQKCAVGLAHNGMLPLTEPNHKEEPSDTMIMCKHLLSPLADIRNAHALISMATTGNRLAILSADGEIDLMGRWEQDGDLYYSNSGYKERLQITLAERHRWNMWENGSSKSYIQSTYEDGDGDTPQEKDADTLCDYCGEVYDRGEDGDLCPCCGFPTDADLMAARLCPYCDSWDTDGGATCRYCNEALDGEIEYAADTEGGNGI